MSRPIQRAYDAATAVDRSARTVVATINTDAIDRYRTVIVPGGGKLDNYRKNPVVLCNHNGESLPIGKNLWIKADGKRKLVAKTQFLPEGKDETADKVFDLYDLGFLNAWSISFDPIEYGPPTPDEVRKRPDLAECRCVYRTWDLLEYSAVTIPGNPEAVRAAHARGLALPGWPEPEHDPLAGLPPLRGTTPEQHRRDRMAAVRALLRSTMSRASRDAQDLARGRV